MASAVARNAAPSVVRGQDDLRGLYGSYARPAEAKACRHAGDPAAVGADCPAKSPLTEEAEVNWKKSSCTSLVVTTAGLAVGFVPAAGAGAAATPTCSQLTKAQIQPLLIHRMTTLTAKPVAGFTYLSSAKQVGQTCVVADTETSSALVVVVIGGSAAARAYASDAHAGRGAGKGEAAACRGRSWQ